MIFMLPYMTSVVVYISKRSQRIVQESAHDWSFPEVYNLFAGVLLVLVRRTLAMHVVFPWPHFLPTHALISRGLFHAAINHIVLPLFALFLLNWAILSYCNRIYSIAQHKWHNAWAKIDTLQTNIGQSVSGDSKTERGSVAIGKHIIF